MERRLCVHSHPRQSGFSPFLVDRDRDPATAAEEVQGTFKPIEKKWRRGSPSGITLSPLRVGGLRSSVCSLFTREVCNTCQGNSCLHWSAFLPFRCWLTEKKSPPASSCHSFGRAIILPGEPLAQATTKAAVSSVSFGTLCSPEILQIFTPLKCAWQKTQTLQWQLPFFFSSPEVKLFWIEPSYLKIDITKLIDLM